jgi:hypothetical protein
MGIRLLNKGVAEESPNKWLKLEKGSILSSYVCSDNCRPLAIIEATMCSPNQPKVKLDSQCLHIGLPEGLPLGPSSGRLQRGQACLTLSGLSAQKLD